MQHFDAVNLVRGKALKSVSVPKFLCLDQKYIFLVFLSSSSAVSLSTYCSSAWMDVPAQILLVSIIQKIDCHCVGLWAFTPSAGDGKLRLHRKQATTAIQPLSISGKRLQNIVDNADRKAHNLYLNHTQATPNAEYVGYEDEETDCSSDISEVDLNLYTYKPSTSNRLISLTDPKHKQLTKFVSKSSQMRLGSPSIAVVGDRLGVSDQAVAAIGLSVLHDVGLITTNNSDLVVVKNNLRREKAKVRKVLRFQALSGAQALPLKGLYFDGRKDSTLIEERVDTKIYMIKEKKEHLSLEEPSSRYITHLSPSFGTAKQNSATIYRIF
ncbi:hypothetical protein AVEN_102528-1 [Araneus ventricosus]|uniref:Uncharacterized protein n=1 Tax=Araneus ventricosus TaxID=182803 RepID=A0A4Y2BI92_ARAVE|nr:hypothetical protein AVEN_102528-1 [Araneus ventricosus]